MQSDSETDRSPLTELIQRAANGQVNAKERLYERVYNDLRSIAHRLMRDRRNNELQTTALVNEVLLRFEKGDALTTIANRRVFFSVAIRAMYQILVDQYRRRKKQIDGPGRIAEPLDQVVAVIEEQVGADFARLQVALDELASESPRQHEVIMHRFFGGLSIRHTAELLDVSVQTVERDWRLSRAKLLRELQDE